MNQINIALSLALLVLICFFGCRKDFEFDPLNQELAFSTDTISVDTVFTNFNSENYVLRVYNRSDDDVLIPRIYLGNLDQSYYKINVNGTPGSDFTNVPIRGNDSLYIFLEIAVPEVESQLYEDDIFFETSSLQNVKLRAWIEKTSYYLPENGSDEVLIDEGNWDNSTVKFIQGKAIVTNNLNIASGTKIYFFNNASLEVEENASLTIEGNLQDKVVFRSYRHDPRYDSLPEQWNKILIQSNATLSVNYAKIMGGKTGLEIRENAIANIRNTEIYNQQDFGLYCFGADVTAENLIINNANFAAMAVDFGGNYDLKHCTLANFFPLDAGPKLSLFLSNENAQEQTNALNATFANSIFWGSNSNAIALDENNAAPFVYNFQNNLIRNQNTTVLDVSNNPNFIANITDNPLFVNTFSNQTNLRLQEESPALNAANVTIANMVPFAFDGNARNSAPDLGAFEQ